MEIEMGSSMGSFGGNDKETAVQIMTAMINDMNRQLGKQNGGMDDEQLEKYINDQQMQLNYVNGLLFDTLKNAGFIKD